MSGLAIILVKRGYSISGSDQNINNSLKNLISHGVNIFKTQSAANIEKICSNKNTNPIVIVSTAIPTTNPELRAAKNKKLEILHRSDLLASLINNQKSIVVAGSHGKTTTSTIITTLLALNKQDPTAIIGGIVPFYKSNGHSGLGKLLVAEADESDGTIIKFKGSIGLITNLELDHTNHYKNLSSLIKIMKEFGSNSKKLVVNYDCEILRENFQNCIYWSTKQIQGIDFAAIPTLINGKETIANFYEKGELIDEITIPLPGIHNLSNTVGAIAACRLSDIPFAEIKKIIHKLESPNRRFQYRGIWKERQFVDDYAHHPSEVEATISISRLMISSRKSFLPLTPKRVIAVFQPHRYSRTRDFLIEFSNSLLEADSVILAPIYGAGEDKIDGINSQSLAHQIKIKKPSLSVAVADNVDHLINLIKSISQPSDLILMMGAGNINKLWNKIQIDENIDENSTCIRQAA